MENYLNGILFEKQTKTHLIMNGNEQVYLWNDIPLDVFIQSKIFESYEDKLKFKRKLEKNGNKHGVSDTGCDIFYLNVKQNRWIIVQCKNYTGTITLDKLAGFYDFMLSTELRGELYYTSKLSEPITRYKKSRLNL